LEIRAPFASSGGCAGSADSRPGGALLLVALIVSLDLYGSEELSKVAPLYSLSYVLIPVIGQLFLGERVTLQRWLGILMIVTGVVVLLES
jgi:uncharacterized membrane protein